MEIVHAVYENGVFRPTSDVSLPERCEVEFEPKVVGQAAGSEARRRRSMKFSREATKPASRT